MTINITEALDRVKNSIYGKDIRQAIVDSIQTAYDDAVKAGNANMEVTLARGLYATLKDRLESLDDSNEDINRAITNIGNSSPKGTYATLTALQSAYPTGTTGIYVVTADGHWYYWNGSAWTDGGVYQSTAIGNKTIYPIHLASTNIQTTKDPATYTSLSKTTSLYIPNDLLLQQGVVNIIGKFAGGSVDFFLLKKSGTTFTVIKKVTKTVVAGVNTVITDLVAEGTGDEYLGFKGAVYYASTGGTGFYETDSADASATSFNSPWNVGGAAFGFSIYLTFSYGGIADKIKMVKADLLAQLAIVDARNTMEIDNLITTTPKDFSLYTSNAQYKLYIPNVALGPGAVTVHFKGTTAETAYFYILKKSGATFTVKQVITVSLVVGENIVDMQYSCAGDGTEYFGYYAHSNYKSTGGTGMYEIAGAVYNEEDTFTPMNSTSGTAGSYDFAIYYEYKNPSVQYAVKLLQTDVEDIKNEIVVPPSIKITDMPLPNYSEITGSSIGYVGRWFDKTINGKPCKATINEGSEFYFKVKGTVNIAVNFEPITSLSTPYFAYSIDGAPLTRQLVTSPNLPIVDTGEHIIRIVCDAVTETEDKWNGEIGFAVSGVTVDAGATVKGIIPKNRTIMFFGDSITEGIRVLNMNADSRGNSGSGAYPFITCNNLNAISYRVGFGATGVTKSGSGGVPKVLQYIDNMTAARPTPYFEPDLIVINHGTNDSGADSATFKSAYNAVLDRLKLKYAGVPIFTMIPFNQAHAQDIRDCVSGRTYCYLVETNGWGVTYTDGVHPDVNGGITAGGKLATQIQSVMGTSYFFK